MIIGNGDIAQAIIDQPDKLFFASGVSNSQCTDWNEFNRERKLLMQQGKYNHLVYFSSLSIYYNSNQYTSHKILMEKLIRENFHTYTIVRLGNITWGNNPNTLINYLTEKISNNEPYETRDVERYIIDKDEFQHWVGMIPSFSTEMNITGQRMNVKYIEECIKEQYKSIGFKSRNLVL